MNPIPQYEQTFLPMSHIKSPGALFSGKKSNSDPQIGQQQNQDLLGVFKSKVASSIDSITNLVTSQSIKKYDETHLDCFMKSHLSGNFANPGKLKTESAERASVLFKAKEILSRYDIDLVVDNQKSSKEVFSVLKTIIPEICFFPFDFFKNIQLKQFIICNGDTSIESTRISVDLQYEPNKVTQRLYQIIWSHIIKSNPDILIKWTQMKSEDDLAQPGKLFYSLEDVFIGLMNNSNHALMKPLIKRLREILVIYYPQAMSEEKFRSRNKEKKKIFRVRFDL